ncbi:MAG: TniQ family protein [Lachnospiraceae bacterium]|nr:TniQ family protein [Lachnospiraceae bacterium]
MIPYFPEFYPDELVYSLFARLYVKCGYPAYRYCAEDLFFNPAVRPDMEFINHLTPEAKESLLRNMPMEEVILKHTMFPYYGRFLPIVRKQKAFQSMMYMEGNYQNLLPLPIGNGGGRYLRYCPACAERDRERYGETYWHREHQMAGVNICPVHGCHLIDSAVAISGKTSPMLTTAEEMVPLTIPAEVSGNGIECRVAGYVSEVFQSGFDPESTVSTGAFLHSRMEGTKYLSIRGEQRNIALFHADFTEYYKDLPDNRFTEIWQIQKVLNDEHYNCYEVCLMALFLNVPARELVHMALPEKPQHAAFDEQVFLLHEQGFKYPEIARRLHAPYDTVKAIGERKSRGCLKAGERPSQTGRKALDWAQIDRDTLPLVKVAVKDLYGGECVRPKKVSIAAVERILDLPGGRISHYLPLCRAEVERYQETQEQYWAREVVWAARQIMQDGGVLNWKHIRNLTNMRKSNFLACLPYLREAADADIRQAIQEVAV